MNFYFMKHTKNREYMSNMTYLVKSIYLRNFDSASKNHILGMYVYVMEAYTI